MVNYSLAVQPAAGTTSHGGGWLQVSTFRSWSSQKLFWGCQGLCCTGDSCLHWAARYWVPNVFRFSKSGHFCPGWEATPEPVGLWAGLCVVVTWQAAQVQIYRATTSVRQSNIYWIFIVPIPQQQHIVTSSTASACGWSCKLLVAHKTLSWLV